MQYIVLKTINPKNKVHLTSFKLNYLESFSFIFMYATFNRYTYTELFA